MTKTDKNELTKTRDNTILTLRAQGIKYEDIARTLTAKGIPTTDNYVCKRFKALERKGLTPPVFKPTTTTHIPTGAVSESQLREKHDKFFIIMNFLRAIPEGNFIDEGQLLKEVKLLGKPGYRDALAREEIKPYKGKVDGTTYYGAIKSINKLKTEGVLQ